MDVTIKKPKLNENTSKKKKKTNKKKQEKQKTKQNQELSQNWLTVSVRKN